MIKWPPCVQNTLSEMMTYKDVGEDDNARQVPSQVKGLQVKGDPTLSEDPLPEPIAMVNTQQSQECPLNGFETVPTASCERGPKTDKYSWPCPARVLQYCVFRGKRAFKFL